MSQTEALNRAPWDADPSWVWDTKRNPKLRKLAPLCVELSATKTDLKAQLAIWLGEFTPICEDAWSWGGLDLVLEQASEQYAVLELASSGEDVFESLVHGANWLHKVVIEPNPDVSVNWLPRPLRLTRGTRFEPDDQPA